MKFDALYDQLTGHCVRRISFSGAPENAVYLTFDDGPHPVCTPKVLDLLKQYQARATFFVIAEKACQYPELIKRMLEEGHTIGDHSADHDTAHYFKNAQGISEWYQRSLQLFSQLKIAPVAYRSPLGIKTPPLNQVLKQNKQPLLLWDVRFYDTRYGLTQRAVAKKLPSIKNGSIILLHDTHENEREQTFLKSLEYLIQQTQKLNLSFLPLNEKLVLNSYLDKYEAF